MTDTSERTFATSRGAFQTDPDLVGFANSGGLVFVDESAKEIPTL